MSMLFATQDCVWSTTHHMHVCLWFEPSREHICLPHFRAMHGQDLHDSDTFLDIQGLRLTGWLQTAIDYNLIRQKPASSLGVWSSPLMSMVQPAYSLEQRARPFSIFCCLLVACNNASHGSMLGVPCILVPVMSRL